MINKKGNEKDYYRHSEAEGRTRTKRSEGMMEARRKARGRLTGNGAEVEVVSNNLLVVVVH